jgi:diacylglycerol kinase family enzyme
MRLPVDVGAALVDGRLHWFVSHLVARRSWWRGRVVAVMSAQWLGRWDVAPGAHPGDGLLDVLDAELDLADRLKARRRLPTGTHVPHPGIRVRRVAVWQTELRPPLDVWLDGAPLGRAAQLSVRVEPGCLTVVV